MQEKEGKSKKKDFKFQRCYSNVVRAGTDMLSWRLASFNMSDSQSLLPACLENQLYGILHLLLTTVVFDLYNDTKRSQFSFTLVVLDFLYADGHVANKAFVPSELQRWICIFAFRLYRRILPMIISNAHQSKVLLFVGLHFTTLESLGFYIFRCKMWKNRNTFFKITRMKVQVTH